MPISKSNSGITFFVLIDVLEGEHGVNRDLLQAPNIYKSCMCDVSVIKGASLLSPNMCLTLTSTVFGPRTLFGMVAYSERDLYTIPQCPSGGTFSPSNTQMAKDVESGEWQ